MLPPGQQSRPDFPRFGLNQYANRFPTELEHRRLTLQVPSGAQVILDLDEAEIERVSQTSDFHCVTTWSYCGANWQGVRFRDLYECYVKPDLADGTSIRGVSLYAQDGYKTSLPLEDLLTDNTLIADTLSGQPLTIDHGAPLRLVAPNHYGYKNLKHLKRIEFYTDLPVLKHGILKFMDHPRVRVSKEERGRYFPGWLLRVLYRPLINRTVILFKKTVDRFNKAA
ncbi:MAG: molybdopterin-dependent oxidoreductase [Pseudomonadota bacterium]